MPLRELVAALSVADEFREGYERTKFKHWVDEDHDRCNTRQEVLIQEAASPPDVSPSCAVTSGTWYSFYDDKYFDDAKKLDIDHMVPLAEAWDSGASQWTAKRRELYANDLTEPVALVAVSATTNRSKADQDPGQWLPPYEPARCQYVADWVTVKTRWGLTVDTTEKTRLTELAGACPNRPILTSPSSEANH
ncbi:HNH endonuclease family protein [Amycolatopsis lurida]|uniref:HNH endonuclease family protein n=1 Tax=Amycolatopsis sp. YIM 10 TaxID=2653857 RepID=UPI0012A9F025|nr:HNH endonuclease family protein [Amycolatopsis sp. YIM 10]QFU86667.1 hypothetical protein YIM_07280 [Amycolatopsis sp. YIM 10]